MEPAPAQYAEHDIFLDSISTRRTSSRMDRSRNRG